VDLIINGTSASLAGELPPITPRLIEPGLTLCYDMMYGKDLTAQLQPLGRRACTPWIAGRTVRAAAEAFALWRDVRPVSLLVLAESRRLLAGLSARCN
jgi:shikimate dehydrogenase